MLWERVTPERSSHQLGQPWSLLNGLARSTKIKMLFETEEIGHKEQVFYFMFYWGCMEEFVAFLSSGVRALKVAIACDCLWQGLSADSSSC